MHHTRTFLYGLLFAVLQYFYFLALESGLAATVTIYMTIIFSWLLGTWISLNFMRTELKPLHILASVGAYLAAIWGVYEFPFDQRLLPLYAVAVGISGFVVGIFFRSFVRHFRESKSLFLWENNGFILGFIIALLGFLKYGRVFMLSFPVGLVLVLIALDGLAQSQRASQARNAISVGMVDRPLGIVGGAGLQMERQRHR